MYPVRIDGEKARLREFAADDVDAIFAIYGDPRVTEHLSFEPRSREQVQQFISSSIEVAGREPRVEYALAVERVDSGELVGSARLAVEAHRAGTIGFALHADHWQRGLGTETVRLLLTLGFDHLGLHRIWAARSPLNTVSQRLLVKAGLNEEGRIRDHVYVNGAWRDSIIHVILEDEWRGHG